MVAGGGAVGAELFARGLTPVEGVERMNLLRPDVVLRLHQDYVAAGSRLIETNTFAASAKCHQPLLTLVKYLRPEYRYSTASPS